MQTHDDTPHPPRFLENLILVVIGLLALVPLYYQLPRWGNGLDPTFVHQRLLEQSTFPFLLRMATVHPIIWIALLVVSFLRICKNYGWKLEK